MPQFDDINPQDWEALLNGMARGQYHLLTGAGINSNCLGGDGNPTPNANLLTEQIIQDFNIITEGENFDLKRAYEFIEDRKTLEGKNRSQYFQYRFSNCTPSWQDIIFRLHWKRIWSLNVDDVLENAFSKFKSDTGFNGNCISYNWDDPFEEIDLDKDATQITHLHGYSKTNRELIFSIVEYFNAGSAKRTWHPVFGDDYLQEPFIVIGAKLREEFDLSEFIRRGNHSRESFGRPSIIVLKSITKIQRNEFAKWGLIPVECGAEVFFQTLNKELINFEISLSESLDIGRAPLPHQARTFLGQFKSLKVNREEQIIPNGHDFYGGDEPIWADILNDKDVKFEPIEFISSEIKDLLNHEQKQIVYFISGDAGTGKSVTLLRIARDLISEGKDVYCFRGEEKLSVQATSWWLKQFPDTILLFDNVADFVHEIHDLYDICKNDSINMTVISTERLRREKIVSEEIPYSALIKYTKSPLGTLSNRDINELISKLEHEGRLGKLTRIFSGDRLNYFKKTANRQIFPAMADLESANGYVQRITREYSNDIQSIDLRHVYTLSCMVHSLGYPLPISIASSAAGISASEILNEVRNGQLFKICVLDSKGLRSRHRLIASKIIENVLSKKERYEIAQNLAIHLSPHISISAILNRTLYYRIVKELMDQRIVLDWLGSKYAQDFYSDIKPYYDWDARYWEQRALAEAAMTHLGIARSFAEVAVKRNKDPFTLNTLGTILMKIAFDSNSPQLSGHDEAYWESVKNLRESVAVSTKKNYPHPYTNFFTNTLHYVSLYNRDQEVDERIIREWRFWQDKAKRDNIFESPEESEVFAKYQSDWMKLVLKVSDK